MILFILYTHRIKTMDWLKELIRNNPIFAFAPAAGINLLSFLTQLVYAMSDGTIDDNELHALMTSASGLELIILSAAILILRKKNKE